MKRFPWRAKCGRLLRQLPLRGRGVVLLAASGLAVSQLGYGRLDLVALALGISGLGACVVAGGLTAAHAVWLRRRLRHRDPGSAPSRSEAGSPFETGFALPSPRLPLVAVDWSWSEPPSSAVRLLSRHGEDVERVRIDARCHTRSVVRRFAVSDVFGLWRIRWESQVPLAVTNLPNVGALRRPPVLHSLAGGEALPHPAGEFEGDRIEIRRYAPGDPVRLVLWKAFARTRQLYVRTPERSLADARRTLAYLVVDAADEPAAAAARVAVAGGALGDEWTLGADGVDETAQETGAALEIIARSGNVDARACGPASGLERFLRAAARGHTRCVVFAPAHDGAWLDAALAAVAAWPGARFVLAADGIVRGATAPLWQRALYTPPDAPGIDAATLSAVVSRIVAAGHGAVFVDRVSGRVAGPERFVPTRLSA